MKQPDSSLFTVAAGRDEPLLAAVERSMAQPVSPLDILPTLTNVALGDPYLAKQLADLHAQYPMRPPPSRGLLARLRTRLVWWLLGPELAQIDATHASLLRLADSLIVQLDHRLTMKDEG